MTHTGGEKITPLTEIAEHKKKPKATTLDFSCQEMSPEYLVITYAQSYYTMDSPSRQQLIAMKGVFFALIYVGDRLKVRISPLQYFIVIYFSIIGQESAHKMRGAYIWSSVIMSPKNT